VTFGLERTVVDGLRLGEFTALSPADFLRTGQADSNGIKIRDQTCAIIGAAAIQGCFLPAFVLRRKPRSGPLSITRPAENQTKLLRLLRSCRDGAQHAAPPRKTSRPLFPPAFAASSTQRPDRATAARAPVR